MASDQVVYTSLTGVPSKEQLQPEEVPVRKTKTPQKYIKFKLLPQDTYFCILSIVEKKHIDTNRIKSKPLKTAAISTPESPLSMQCEKHTRFHTLLPIHLIFRMV